jgi:polysaccharide transporter, PST family
LTELDSSGAVTGPPETGTTGSADKAEATDSITSSAVRGASFLFGREAIGSIVRLVGVVITVRIIGPSGYGIYSAAAAYVAIVVTVAQMGSEIYLIRAVQTPTSRLNNEIFTLLMFTSLIATGVAMGLTYLCEPLVRPVGVLLPLRVLLLCIPINVLWAPAQAQIERRFDYMKMGLLELGGDIVLYATAIPLAFLNFGAWSLVAGYFAWQTFLLIGSLVLSGLRPRFAWSFRTARDVARHGTTYSTSTLFINLASAVNPLVVGSISGAAGVGYVSFAQSLVTTVGFAKRAAYRLGIVTMARIHRDNPSQFRKGIEHGAFLLSLGLAVPFTIFGLFAHWAIPLIFGTQWKAAIPVYCWLALAALVGAIPMIESSLFYALGRNSVVAVTTFMQTSLLAIASVGLVELYGATGFGIASVIAIISFLNMDRQARKITKFSYRLPLLVIVITAPSMFIPLVPEPYGLAFLAPWLLFLLVRPLRVATFELAQNLRSSLKKKVAA